ncbi:MAG: acetyltransferase [Bacteroidetes bacterium]|nr:acetyltransferase [Bacteroidota bacterium]
MIIYGASGHGKVIIDILELNGIRDIIVWDDSPKTHLDGYEVVLPDTKNGAGDVPLIISIGDNANRKKVAEKLGDTTLFFSVVHPSATISKSASINAGTVVMSGVSVNPDTIIGKHCIINTNASVDHDCIIEDYVHISPNVALCGDVSVGEGTHIGAGSVVIPGRKIGKWCVIGAGSVIIEDVPDGATVVGNPGKVIKTSKTD